MPPHPDAVSAASRMVCGATVEWMSTVWLGRAASAIPPGPVSTAWTWLAAGTQILTTSLVADTSAGDVAAVAPAATAVAMAAGSRSYTTTVRPCVSRRDAMAAPICPSPMYPQMVWSLMAEPYLTPRQIAG